jgi:hypothetical protein
MQANSTDSPSLQRLMALTVLIFSLILSFRTAATLSQVVMMNLIASILLPMIITTPIIFYTAVFAGHPNFFYRMWIDPIEAGKSLSATWQAFYVGTFLASVLVSIFVSNELAFFLHVLDRTLSFGQSISVFVIWALFSAYISGIFLLGELINISFNSTIGRWGSLLSIPIYLIIGSCYRSLI